MAKIVAIVNQKGGVGKTTTSINLAAAFVLRKCRILLIDLDPQGNATVGSGVHLTDKSNTIKDVLLQNVSLENTIQKSPGGYDILPTTHDLIVAEVQLMQMTQRELCLKNALSSLKNQYDYILIDCPPSLNILTVNALTAAQNLLIPVQCEYFALEGLTSLLNTIKQIQQINPNLNINGLLRTLYDGRNRLAADVSNQLMQYFPGKVYETVIPRNIRLAEAPSHGVSIFQYDKKSQGALAYLALANEILRRQENSFFSKKESLATEE